MNLTRDQMVKKVTRETMVAAHSKYKAFTNPMVEKPIKSLSKAI